MVKGSFIENDIIFEMSRDGVFENSRVWNRKTGEVLDAADFRDRHLKALNLIDASNYILDRNLLLK
jgi:hypothetical protein